MVTQRPADTTAMEGEIVRVQPIVTGTPQPTVAWYYEGQLMASDYATELSEDGTLTFVCVETKHSGTYRYTVSNSAGSVQGQVKIVGEEGREEGREEGGGGRSKGWVGRKWSGEGEGEGGGGLGVFMQMLLVASGKRALHISV